MRELVARLRHSALSWPAALGVLIDDRIGHGVKQALPDSECVDPILKLPGVDQRPHDVVVEIPEP
ncbi:hypothetical protein, partial [Rhodococcus triatomae]